MLIVRRVAFVLPDNNRLLYEYRFVFVVVDLVSLHVALGGRLLLSLMFMKHCCFIIDK